MRKRYVGHKQHGPYMLFSENLGWYTLYSLVNTQTGFAVLHHKILNVDWASNPTVRAFLRDRKQEPLA